MKTRLLLIVGMLFLIAAGFVSAQDVPPPEEQVPLTALPFSRPINPDLYLVRPGDVLQVVFIKSQLEPLTLTVDAEGRVVDKTIGMFDVSNMTLTEARQVLEEALRPLYNVSGISIGINQSRLVSISVEGTVAIPGTYNVFTSQTVSDVLFEAGGIIPGGSTRWVMLTGGPTSLKVDLDRAAYLSDLDSDPNVYAGQTIKVPNKSKNSVHITGEVNDPREVELVPGDDLPLLLRLAGGIRRNADTSAIQIIRKSGEPYDGKLQAGDVILVPARKLPPEQTPLILFGGVKNQGYYQYTDGLTLDGLIEQAGGVTPDAIEANTIIFRKPKINVEGQITDSRYPISRIAQDGQGFYSTPLQPDDSVYVPLKIGFIRIYGAVRFPGLLPYIEGRDALFYIKSAGGFLPVANRDEISIYNPVSKITSLDTPGVVVSDGSVLTVELREELK